jgi:small subunit ribosomal protein S9
MTSVNGPESETTDVTEAPEATEAPQAPEATEAPQATEAPAEVVGKTVTEEAPAAPREPIVIDRPIQTVGRRKEAVVRVRLVPGTGKFDLDGRSLEAYFPNKVHQQIVNEPFVLLGLEGQFDVLARVNGGGTTGQAGALRLGISRALQFANIEHRAALKKAGFLTRDARVPERKKAGLKKARKAPQYSKR